MTRQRAAASWPAVRRRRDRRGGTPGTQRRRRPMGAATSALRTHRRWGMDMSTEASTMALPRQANSLATLEIIPTGKALGAEIRGVDLSLPIPDDVKRAIRQAWLDHLVVLFRGQTLTPEQYLEAARIFGTPQIGGARKYYEKAGLKSRVYALPSRRSRSCRTWTTTATRPSGTPASAAWKSSGIRTTPISRSRPRAAASMPARCRPRAAIPRSTTSISPTRRCPPTSSRRSRAAGRSRTPPATARACCGRA